MPQLTTSASSSAREFLINADFDLSLRPNWRGPGRLALAERIRDFAHQFLVAGGPEDTLLVQDAVPGEFIDYLARKQIRHLTPVLWPEINPERRLVPFGWNQEAEKIACRYRQVPDHPALDIVRKVNSRSFSASLEQELFPGGIAGAQVHSRAELDTFLSRHKMPEAGWLLKANHSNAALGNLRLGQGYSPRLLGKAVSLVEANGSVLIEPWLHRRVDLSVTFDLHPQGGMSKPIVHEVVNTAGGAFKGRLLGKSTVAATRWYQALHDTAVEVAGCLERAGYFGPVCFDAFSYEENGRELLRSLVEINARLWASFPGQAMQQELGTEGVFYMRAFATDRFDFAGSVKRLEAALGSNGYDPSTRRGVLLTSSLSLGTGESARNARQMGILFAGNSQQEVMEMDRSFRRQTVR